MPKILHINDYPCEPATGGAEVVMARTCALLQAAGLETETLTSADLVDARRTVWRYFHNRFACNALREKIRTFRPDVVHLHNYYHLLSPAILDILASERRPRHFGIVMTLHDYHLVCPNAGGHWVSLTRGALCPIDPARVDTWAYRIFRKWDSRGLHFSILKQLQHTLHRQKLRATGLPDILICPSRFLQELARPVVARTEFLPHPVPPLPKALVRRPSRLRLAYAGRLEREKGIAEFLQEVPVGYPADFVVVGGGSDRARLEHLVQQRGLNVRFLGRLSLEETHREIAQAHLLVQPSKCLESYGLTLIEALAFGTNVLASDRGAMREIVESSGTGFLFDPDRPESLRNKLEEIGRVFRSGDLNRFDVAQFLRQRSESAYLQRLLDLYEVAACGLASPRPSDDRAKPRAA